MTKKLTGKNKLKRNVDLIIFNEFVTELRFYFPVAIIGFQALTGSFTLAMSVFAVASLLQAFLEIPTGILSDKWGRRATFISGAVSELTALLCYIFAFSSPFPLLGLYAGSFFYGLANALFSGNNHAMVYETLACYRKTKETSKILGRVASMGQAGACISGVTASAFLWLGVSFESLILLSLLPLSLSVVIAYLTIEPPNRLVENDNTWQHMKKAIKVFMTNTRLRLLSIASIVHWGGGMANYYFTPGFIESVWPLWLAPFFRTLQHAIGAASFWFAGFFIKLFGAMRVIFFGSLIGNIIALTAYALSNIFSPILLTLNQMTYAVSTTANNAIKQDNFSDAQRSTMGSLISFFSSIMTAVGALFLGWLSDLSSPAFAMATFMLMRFVVVQPIYYRLYREPNG